MNKRIFIAINLPSEARKEIYERISKKIDKEKCKVVGEKNLHITLRFLGYLGEEALEELKEKMKALSKEEGFRGRITGVGEFNGRIVWIGMEEGKEKMNELSNKLSEVIGVGDERFHPHVTLARVKKMMYEEVKELRKELNELNYSREIEVKSVDLMESVLERNGPKYLLLQSFPLKFL
ncbi:MAG: RNA 2',3'-cyclic phosphodiesterase [archaeon]|nr:RNA 2',3'-cyclic phosphodiesterase [Candidatus Micrarchaeota archaeon]